MIKLKDILTEGKLVIGKGDFANIYDMKKEISEGKFDPKNPTIHVIGLGVYNLKLLGLMGSLVKALKTLYVQPQIPSS